MTHSEKPVYTASWTPHEVLSDLKKRGYDDAAALAFAQAERSWTERESPERQLWSAVEKELQERTKDT